MFRGSMFRNRYILKFSLALVLCGCPESSTSSGGAAVPSPSSDATGIKPLTVTVGTLYEALNKDTDAGSIVKHATCEIPPNSKPGTIAACRTQIPEGQLFYSKLILTMTADTKSSCELMTFRPYYYMASNRNGFLPNWGTSAVDCFGPSSTPGVPYTDFNLTPKECFNGPAKVIVADFPAHVWNYFVVTDDSQREFEIPSGNSLKAYNRPNNRYASNALASGQRGVGLTFSPVGGVARDGYVAGTLQDYQFTCLDKFDEEQYRLTLVIEELDRKDGEPGVNDIEGWEAALGN